MLYRPRTQKTKVFLALLLCLCAGACVRTTDPFPVPEQEQSQDDQFLKGLNDTRATNMVYSHGEKLDYNRVPGRDPDYFYHKDNTFRLNMVGLRVLAAAYPLCPTQRRSTSMMVGISARAHGHPVIDWAIAPFGQADEKTLKLGDEIISMGNEDIKPNEHGAMQARRILADYANRFQPLHFDVQRGDDILHITQQPKRFCRYELKIGKDGEFNAHADDTAVIVDSKMFDYLTTDDELAFVIGHETTHNVMRHRNIRIWAHFTFFFEKFFERKLEGEADYIGAYLAAAAGYDPEGALSMTEILARDMPEYINGSGDEDATYAWSPMTIFEDHPPTGERYTQLRYVVDRIKLKQAEGLPVLPDFNDD